LLKLSGYGLSVSTEWWSERLVWQMRTYSSIRFGPGSESMQRMYLRRRLLDFDVDNQMGGEHDHANFIRAMPEASEEQGE
jgi:hypothetical protein